MKITMKPLKGATFEVEVDAEETVCDLKKKVEAARSEFPAEQQKLIHAGRILKDESKIQELGLKPTDFLVVMAGKGKAAEPKAAAPAPAQQPDPAAAAPPAGSGQQQQGPAAGETAAANRVSGAGSEAAVQQLCDMGFARPEVERCLAAAFGNPDRAVEYLMSGIPEAAMEPAGGAPPPQAPALGAGTAPPAGGATAFPAMGSPGGGGAEMPPELAAMRDNPQFGQLAAMVAQNPHMLAQMLPALAQTNPELAQVIRQNPEAFMQMLQEAVGGGDDEEDEDDPVEAMLAAAQQGGGGGVGGGGGGGGGMVQLSEAENAAVGRLMALGFDRGMCVQAYIACEKNEELAANFLFDSGGDDMMQG